MVHLDLFLSKQSDSWQEVSATQLKNKLVIPLLSLGLSAQFDKEIVTDSQKLEKSVGVSTEIDSENFHQGGELSEQIFGGFAGVESFWVGLQLAVRASSLNL